MSVVHQPTGLLPIENSGEPSVLYAWIFLLLAAFGPGPWALERLLSTGRQEPQSVAVADQAAANA
ncbi:DoxX family protein [Streptomyces sp. NPDC001848]|uniref:DoxX family protein n=1 Tax=Streptomyces sp. NPDC001848 TaxID=3364618 RepID=UPI003699F277